jgi:type VI secretion system protein ImpA
MMIFDVLNLAQTLDASKPCGQDAEYTPLFMDMEKAKQGEPERQVGESTISAIEPDWKTVKKQALELSTKTRDLRVATSLTSALLHTDSFPGFCSGLELTTKLLENCWECLYPELDSEDANPAMMRSNSLLELAALPFLSSLRKQPLIHSKVLGKFSLQAIQEASDYKNSSVEEEKQKHQLVEAAFREAAASDTLPATLQTLQGCLQHLDTINRLFETNVGYTNAPNLSPLRETLNQAIKLIAPRIPASPPLNKKPDTSPQEQPSPSLIFPQSNPSAINRDTTMPIQNRDEVRLALEQVCTYYATYEPSSPVPILIKRAIKLIDKDFMKIIEDLYPDSINHLEQLFGLNAKDHTN